MKPSRVGGKPRTFGLGAAVVAAALWDFGGIIVKIASLSALQLTFYRLWIGAVALTAITLATGRRVTWMTMRQSWLGGLLFAGDLITFFSAVKLTSIVVASLIGAFQPALVFVLARRMFGERFHRWDVLWIALSLVGVVITVVGAKSHGHQQIDGDLFAFGALLFWTAYWLVSKRSRRHLDALEYTTGATITAAFAITLVALITGQHLGGVNGGGWFWIVLLAVVPGSGHLIMNWAHRYVDASISSVIGNLSSLVAAVAAFAILGQVMTVLQIVGVAIGLSAIAVVAYRQREPASTPLEPLE
jgi:drug/metabolite transporter (DMT)-like permease